ncbi:trimeric intracellular cation channel family protein [Catalinimonas niigatensis]|uniref:trimeric intracellular cation channel family protein n=1 Tax=Catalinimonas niigatensis TaxID=1397264 RepID=UPI002666EB88|nr:trimeric intracellular cation channel family protein [Catalinimonas niigatensis]WPP51749.1 trimeric intracellular cation channel family protein [Catalinimonas niigatensis]
MTDLLYLLEIIGTFVFAVSGIITASERKMDPFGASVIAFITAVGGGTVRDVLIGSVPVGWMLNLHYLYTILAGILVTFLMKKQIMKLHKTMFLFDAIGIGLFTILGLQKTMAAGLSPLIGVMMGTVSAVFGGVLRDIFSNRVPLIFRNEIYATACLLGGLVFLLLGYLGVEKLISTLGAMLFVIVLRLLAVRFKWYLPTLK